MRSAASCPDEVIDQLLAGAQERGGDRRAGRLDVGADQAGGGAGARGRADRPPRLRAASRAARWDGEHAERVDAEDAVRPSTGRCRIDTPRDRDGSFEPKLVRKRQRRFEGFDEKILALYSPGVVDAGYRGVPARALRRRGRAGPDLRVTDAVMDDVRAWQQRPLEDVYPVVFLDCMVLKIRDGGSVQRRACYLALAIDDGRRPRRARHVVPGDRGREVLDAGPHTSCSHRGVRDILIAASTASKGSPRRSRRSSPRPRCRRASCI